MNSKPPPIHETARGNGQVTTGQSFKNSPKTTDSNDRLQVSFPAEFLNSLKPRLADYLAARGVELRKQGNRLVARCPNHEDSKPSFAVFGTRQENCGCYPCGFTGDIFSVSEWLGRSSSFPESVKDVCAALGIALPQGTAGTAPKPTTAPPRASKAPASPFTLSIAERKTVHAARLAFSDAFWSGDTVVDRIAESLGIDRETLRIAAWGSSGLGLACPIGSREPWLCYAYPEGLKWRNPHPATTPRFRWIVGKATTPWRWEWASDKPTVYVTEGESDCLALIAAGMESETAACVATPGTSFQREWAGLFTGKKVVLCFDSDNAGRAATATVAAILKGHAAEILTWRAGA